MLDMISQIQLACTYIVSLSNINSCSYLILTHPKPKQKEKFTENRKNSRNNYIELHHTIFINILVILIYISTYVNILHSVCIIKNCFWKIHEN